uniref:Large ribosomal subunit protein bL9m n=1 Tax=Strigamia maritima TaxID=126957 RepID=T1IZI1_STRMM
MLEHSFSKMLRLFVKNIKLSSINDFQLSSQFQHVKKTHVVHRRNVPDLSRSEGKRRKLKQRNSVYDWQYNTDSLKYPRVTVILTEDVEGIGSAGEIVPVKPSWARNYLLPTNKAIHPHPSNLAKLEEDMAKGLIPEKKNSTLWAPLTAKTLSAFILPIFMHLENSWTLEPWHIRVSFRFAGYIVAEDAITMPTQTISGPNLDYEGREFPIKVTINNKEWAYVRCRIHHWTALENKQLAPIFDYWFFPAEPLFPEDTELLNKLPKPSKNIINSKFQ